MWIFSSERAESHEGTSDVVVVVAVVVVVIVTMIDLNIESLFSFLFPLSFYLCTYFGLFIKKFTFKKESSTRTISSVRCALVWKGDERLTR